MTLTMRRAIRKAIKQDYHRLHSYDKTGSLWGISGGMAWKFINEEYYWPADEQIEKMILLVASHIGIRLSNRSDLWSMPAEELIWRLENREEYGNNTDTP